MLPPNKHNKKRNHKRNQRIPEKSDIPNQANFKEGAGATTHFTSCEPHPTPQPAAQPSIEPPRQTSIMALRSTPAQADWAASKGPFFSDRRLWPSGSRAKPWSLFAFFLSIQKEGPRRRGGRRDALKTTEKGTERNKPPNPVVSDRSSTESIRTPEETDQSHKAPGSSGSWKGSSHSTGTPQR